MKLIPFPYMYTYTSWPLMCGEQHRECWLKTITHSGIVDISGARFFVIYHLNGNHNFVYIFVKYVVVWFSWVCFFFVVLEMEMVNFFIYLFDDAYVFNIIFRLEIIWWHCGIFMEIFIAKFIAIGKVEIDNIHMLVKLYTFAHKLWEIYEKYSLRNYLDKPVAGDSEKHNRKKISNSIHVLK